MISGVVADITVKALFKHFCYKFEAKLYHQKQGGLVRVRATRAPAQLVMENKLELRWGSVQAETVRLQIQVKSVILRLCFSLV